MVDQNINKKAIDNRLDMITRIKRETEGRGNEKVSRFER